MIFVLVVRDRILDLQQYSEDFLGGLSLDGIRLKSRTGWLVFDKQVKRIKIGVL